MLSRITITITLAILLLSSGACKKAPVVTPESALSELLANPKDNSDSALKGDYVLVGRPTYKIRTAPTATPSHFATVTGSMDSRGTRYRFTFIAFCKDNVWYFDPDGPMLLEQPNDSWSSSDPEYALHHCQMAATYSIGFKR